jgi:hypothetical protein
LLLSLAAGLPAPAPKNVQVREENHARPSLVLQTNDDGWLDVNIRTLYYNLTDAGVHSIISAPPNDPKGPGSKEADPKRFGSEGCIYESCPPFSPTTGMYTSEPAFNVNGIEVALYTETNLHQWVNAPPVTAVKYGMSTRTPGISAANRILW